MLKLQFKDRRREAVWLVDHTFSIGKNPRNSLMINDDSILDFHAEIINEHETLTLVDKSAGKGIWVNGVQITSHVQIKKNDIIKLGQVELQLVDPKAGATLEPAKTQSKAVEGSWAIHSKASWLNQNRFDISSRVIIGREPSCDITLPLDHLSRKHASLEVKSGQLYIEDLDSSNGTYVNGERVKSKMLKPGDKVKMDVVTFDVIGPTSDPNKTIIRTAPADGAVNKASAAKPAPRKAAHADPRKPAQVKPKKLAAGGKQEWIAGEAKVQPKSNSGLIVGIIVIAVGVGAALMFL